MYPDSARTWTHLAPCSHFEVQKCNKPSAEARTLIACRLHSSAAVHGFQNSHARPSPPFFLPPLKLRRLSQESAGGSTIGDPTGFEVSGGADTLTMLVNHCRSSQEGKAFLYDELALSAATGALGGGALDALVDMLSGSSGVRRRGASCNACKVSRRYTRAA